MAGFTRKFRRAVRNAVGKLTRKPNTTFIEEHQLRPLEMPESYLDFLEKDLEDRMHEMQIQIQQNNGLFDPTQLDLLFQLIDTATIAAKNDLLKQLTVSNREMENLKISNISEMQRLEQRYAEVAQELEKRYEKINSINRVYVSRDQQPDAGQTFVDVNAE
ncbi:MAG: hypothetical protein IJ825_05875 [Oscillospiraceae bacterium]|nr:hypothetical protein [Oscillospiraceae bacterium]